MREDRDSGLFSAVVAVAAGLELGSTLRRIVQAAVDLVDAEYGALGVLDTRGFVVDFIHVGIDSKTADAIGSLPTGRGILGLLVDHPVPIRLENLTAHPASAGFPEGHPPMESFLGVPVRVRGEVFGNLYLTQKRGGQSFTAEDERTVMALAAAAAVAIENARLYEQTRQRERWQRAIAEIANAVLTGVSEDEVLRLVAERAQALSDADVALIALPHQHADCTIEVVHVGSVAPEDVSRWSVHQSRRAQRPFEHGDEVRTWQGSSVPAGSLIHECLASGVRVDAAQCQLQPGDADQVDFGATVAIPLLTGERVLGVLILLRAPDAPPISRDAIDMAELFAGQAAVSLVLAEAQREQERLAVFEDRDRIARDLHDLVIQRLFATGMSLQGIMRLAEVPEPAVDRVNRAVDELDETIREIRQTIFALHEPVEGPSTGTRGRALREIRQSAALLGFEPAIRFVGPIDAMMLPTTEEHLIAAMREALTNAAKHAHASQVDVVISLESGDVVLTVTDDGVGFNPESAHRSSGLANLGARAQDLGGTSTLVRVSDDGGSRLVWRVPIT